MIKISVRGDIRVAIERLSLAERQVPYATARALTKTAKAVQLELEKEIKQVFDRPTPFTERALYTNPATKARLVAEVGIKDWAAKGNAAVKYLFAEVHGGGRSEKGFEKLLQNRGLLPAGWYAIPGKNVPVDAYGNISRSLILKILSQVGAMRDPGQNEKVATKRKRNKKQRLGRFFAVAPRQGRMTPGIYERVTFASGSAIRPVLIFTPRRPMYRQRYRFYELGQELARRIFPREFEEAARIAMGTQR